jgi:polyhydroxyalkanoate synthesis regulator phasin
MDILGITYENRDIDMIMIIAKEGINYFFDRFDKFNLETQTEDYDYFCQYFNNYLFQSDIWEITLNEQFKILARDVIDDTNIRDILSMINPENLQQFWDNLLTHIDLIKMCKFLEVPDVYKYYMNHPLWNVTNDNPQETLLLKKLYHDIELVDNVYHIIYTLLKNKESNPHMINWIVDVCEHADIPVKPIIRMENMVEIIHFSRDNEKQEQEKYNRDTLVYFNTLKIFMNLFENGINNIQDANKIHPDYLRKEEDKDREEPKDYNFLTIIFFNLQKMTENCYLFKINELKQRKNSIEELEDEIDQITNTYPSGLTYETSRILEVMRETIILEKSRCEFIRKEISFRKNCRIGQFYLMSCHWIIENAEHIKTNSVNDIIGNTFQFFLNEKITSDELYSEEEYRLYDLFQLCSLVLSNESLSSDPSHKMDGIYICSKHLTQLQNIHYRSINNMMSFYKNNSDTFYEALINTTLFLKGKLDDYGESYKLHINNVICNMMDYAHFKFNMLTIPNKDKYKKFIGILIENTNSSLEYWVNNVKHVKKIQEEAREDDISLDEIEELRGILERSGHYLKLNMKIMSEICSPNFNLIISDEIVKKFSNSVGYILETLVGERRRELSIKDKEMYGFHPVLYLKFCSDIIACFACSGKFIDAMGSNSTYNTAKLCRNLTDVLIKKGDMYQMRGEVLRQFMEKVEQVQKVETARDEIEIPDEFCDPIMQTLIETPVILPETDIVMDREVICRHLLTEETNPFNREKLSIESLDEYNSQENIKTRLGEFKERVEAWKREAEF